MERPSSAVPFLFSGARWCAVLLLGAVTLVAGAYAARGQTANVATYALDQVEVGAVAPSPTKYMLAVENRRFTAVAADLVTISQPTQPKHVAVPLVGVLGEHKVSLTPARATVDGDTYSVAFTGASTTAGGVLAGAQTQVLVLVDWVSDTDDKPTVVVSARGGPRRLGEILRLTAGSSIPADIGLSSVSQTVGSTAIDPNDDPAFEHISWKDNLTAAAVEHFQAIYTVDGIPDQVPALKALTNNVHLSGTFPLDAFGDVPQEVLGYADGAGIVVEGSLGVTINGSAAFNPTTAGWSLSGLLPRASNMSIPLPFDLELRSSARFGLKIAYTDVLDSEEDPKRKAVTVAASADMTTDLLGGTRELLVGFEITRGGGTTGLAVSVKVGEWAQPFGITFLKVQDVFIDGSFKKASDGTKFEGSLLGYALVAGKQFELKLEGKVTKEEIDADIELFLDDTVRAGELLDAIGAVPGELPLPQVLNASFLGPAGIHIGVVRPRSGGSATSTTTSSSTTSTTVQATGTRVTVSVEGTFNFPLPNGDTIGASVMFSLDKDRRVVAAVRPTGQLKLSTILSPIPGIELPFDMNLVDDAAGNTIGFVYATSAMSTTVNQLPKATRAFYRPLLGRSPDSASDDPLDFGAGVSVLGSYALPDTIAGIVGTLGAQSRVAITGTLPIFAAGDQVVLFLALQLKSDHLPDFIEQLKGGLKVDVKTVEGKRNLQLGIQGELFLKMPAGVPGDVARWFQGAGIPVEEFKAVSPTTTCYNGTSPRQASDNGSFYCYDRLKLLLDSSFVFDKKGLGLDILAEVSTPGAVGATVWHPFGFRWFAIDQLKLHLTQLANTDGTLERDFGFLGNIHIADKDLFVALELGIVLMPEPPFVRPEFKGLKVGSGAGLSLLDLITLQRKMADTFVSLTGLPDPGRIPESINVPNVSIRNLELSLSKDGVPDLCIPAGLHVTGDLYLNPLSSAPVDRPGCLNQTTVIKEENKCHNRHLDGCVISSRMRVSYDGIVAYNSLAGLDHIAEGLGAQFLTMGPVHWDDVFVDFALKPLDQHLFVSGGARLENFTPVKPPDNLIAGELKIRFQPLDITVFGEVDVLGFGALVDIKTGINVLTNPSPQFEAHVLLASDDYNISGRSFAGLLEEHLYSTFGPISAVATVAGDVFGYFVDDPFGALQALPVSLQGNGIDVPDWANDFGGEFWGFMEDVKDVIEHAPGSTFDKVMNGIEPFEFDGVEGEEITICWFWTPWGGCEEEETICLGLSQLYDGDECYVIPPIDFPGIPGICDAVFPDTSEFSVLRDSDGDCTLSGLRKVVAGVFGDELGDIVATVGSSVNPAKLLDAVLDGLSDPLPKLECAEFFLRVNTSDTFSNLRLVGDVFGQPFGFQLDFNFFDPINGIPRLARDFLSQVVNPGSVSCLGYDDSLFGASTSGSTAVRLALEAPESADEGTPVQIRGSFGFPLPAERTVKVRWGDGNIEDVVVAQGTDGFVLSHNYVDDDPTGTPADVRRIVATDLTPGGRSDSRALTLRNVAPTATSFTVTSESVVEAGFSTFRLEFTDPGASDEHRVSVDWGDSRVSTARVRPNERSIGFAHNYFDDDPTGTPADVYNIKVTLSDDDNGVTTMSYPVTVGNVPPSDLQVELVEFVPDGTVLENEPLTLRFRWTDPGRDSHRVVIDLGTGADPIALIPALGGRQEAMGFSMGDNGTFTVRVTVTDDDQQSVSTTLPVTVGNVHPDLAINRDRTYLAPGANTFMVRQDVSLDAKVNAIDPGSDDITFNWAWGDGGTDAENSRVNPPQDDPLPSPSRQPRDVVNGKSHTYAAPCLYWLEVTSPDDDSGTDSDRAPVVVVGKATRAESFGWWSEEYRHFGRPNAGQIDEPALLCYLHVVNHLSRVFGDAVALETAEDALDALLPGGGGDQRALRLRQLDQALLSAWLNVANGATGTDPSGFILPEFARVLNDAETLRTNPRATADQLFNAQRAVETAVRNFSRQ